MSTRKIANIILTIAASDSPWAEPLVEKKRPSPSGASKFIFESLMTSRLGALTGDMSCGADSACHVAGDCGAGVC